jgi:hypothetical protein
MQKTNHRIPELKHARMSHHNFRSWPVYVLSGPSAGEKDFFLSAGVRFLWITMRLPKIKEMPGKHKHV